MADARGTARRIRERCVNLIKRGCRRLASPSCRTWQMPRRSLDRGAALPFSYLMSPIALEARQGRRTTRLLTVRGCRPLVTPAIGDFLIPRFAVRHPWVLWSHRCITCTRTAAQDRITPRMPCSSADAAAMGTARMSRITPQMDANGAPLSGSVTSHEMGGVATRSDP